MFITILTYLIVFSVSTCVVGLIGKVIISLFVGFSSVSSIKTNKKSLTRFSSVKSGEINDFEKIFLYLIVGLAVIITMTALIISCFQSVFVILAVLLVIIYFEHRQQTNSRLNLRFYRSFFHFDKRKLTTLFMVSSAAIIVFMWQALFYLKSGSYPIVLPHENYIYYARLSDALWHTGNENNFFYAGEIIKKFTGITPYHYFELWLNGLLSHIFHTNELSTLMLVSIPILLITLFVGFCALVSKISSNSSTFSIFLMAITGLFFAGYFPMLYAGNLFNRYAENVMYNPMLHVFQKTTPMYIIATLSMWYLLSFKIKKGLLVLLALPIITITAAPGILGGIFMFLFFSLFKKSNRLDTLKYMSYTLLVTLLIAGIYYYLGSGSNSLIIPKSKIFTDAYLADMVYLIKTIPLQQAAIYLIWIAPLLLLGSWKKKFLLKGIPKFWRLTGSIWAVSLAFWITFRFLGWDAIQFFTMLAPVFINLGIVVTVWSMITYLQDRKKRSAYLYISFCCVLIGIIIVRTYNENQKTTNVTQYSDSYIAAAKKINTKLNNPTKVFTLNKATYQDESGKNTYFKIAGKFFGFLPGKDNFISIDDFAIPDGEGTFKLHEKDLKENSVFYKFIQQQKDEGTFISVEESQFELCKHIGAQILLVQKGGEVSELIKKHVSYDITDVESGETLMVLDLQNKNLIK